MNTTAAAIVQKLKRVLLRKSGRCAHDCPIGMIAGLTVVAAITAQLQFDRQALRDPELGQ
jgi:hypothetical protein